MKLFTTRRRTAAAALAVAVTGSLLAATGPSAEAGTSAPNNPAAIIIDATTADASPQSVAPYPSNLTTWGIDGPITDINVDLDNVTFGVPGDMEILLVSPTGTAVMLFSDSCSWTEPVIQTFWTIDDEAGAVFPASLPAPQACSSGSWRPTDSSIGLGRELPAPAPPPSGTYPYYARTLAAFDGENPNGTWKLYVADDQPRPGNGADHGVILGGFRLIITTASRSVVVPAGTSGGGPASSYPVVQSVTGQNGRIDDVFVYLRNITHSRPDDLDVLLVAPNGQTVMLMSDACGGIPSTLGTTWRFNDADPVMPDHGICSTVAGGSGLNYRPTNHAPAETLPPPAPPGPYGTSLSALRGLNPNGEWRLYVHDDLTDHSGYLDGFLVSFDLAPPVEVDRTPPGTTITGAPAESTRARKARFAFNASETPATFACRLDNRAWAPCTSPRTHVRLTVGRHVFRVRATDEAGNQDPTPAIVRWRVRR